MKTTYYSSNTIYGYRHFIMVNNERKVFSKGMTGSYIIVSQPGLKVENLTQKQLKEIATSLLELGYTEVSYRKYYEVGYYL